MFLSWYCEHLLLFFKEPKKREITDVFLKRILKMIKEKYTQCINPRNIAQIQPKPVVFTQLICGDTNVMPFEIRKILGLFIYNS